MEQYLKATQDSFPPHPYQIAIQKYRAIRLFIIWAVWKLKIKKQRIMTYLD